MRHASFLLKGLDFKRTLRGSFLGLFGFFLFKRAFDLFLKGLYLFFLLTGSYKAIKGYFKGVCKGLFLRYFRPKVLLKGLSGN